MKRPDLHTTQETVCRFANYLEVFAFSSEERLSHVSNFRQIALWYHVHFRKAFDIKNITLAHIEKLTCSLRMVKPHAETSVSFADTLAIMSVWVSTMMGDESISNPVRKRLSPAFLPALGLAALLCLADAALSGVPTVAGAQDIIIDGESYTHELSIPKTTTSAVYFRGGGVFSDSRFASMRLENFAVKEGENWVGPDFIIAQSNGAGVFYLQAGGNMYSAGTLNFSGATIRNNLHVLGNIVLDGTLTRNGEAWLTGSDVDSRLSAYYTSDEIDSNFSGYYTSSEVDNSFSGYYTSAEIDTSLLGYYTAAQVDMLIAAIPLPTSIFTTALSAPSATFSGAVSAGSLTVLGAASFQDGAISWSSIDSSTSSLSDIGDISFSTLSDGQALGWDSVSGVWTNQNLFGAGAQEQMADFTIYQESSVCYAFSGSGGSVYYSGADCALVIQSAIAGAGDNGVLAFRKGNYEIATELTPRTRQTWWVSEGAIFTPAGNNRILNIHGIDIFTLHGTLAISDPSSHSTSTEAIRIDDMSQSYFEHISIVGYWRGISMSGTLGGTNENNFADIYMQVRDRGLSLETSCHDNHFNHIWIKGPSPTVWASGSGIYIATTGTQGGNTFDHVEILDMNIGMELPGAFETWFGNIVVDNPYGAGITVGGSCERLFFDTLWTASGGDGLVIQGNVTSPADKIQINKIYSWLNGNYGIRVDGYVENLTIGMATVQRNAKGFAISGVENKDIHVSTLSSYENTTYGVDGSGSTENVFIDNAMIYDTALGLDYFTKIGGTRIGSGLFSGKGIAKVLNGQSTVTVSHGLENTPTIVNLTPYSTEAVGAYISAKDATSFTITVPIAVSDDREIGWQAESGRQLGPELLTNQSIEDGTSVPDDWFASADGALWSATAFRSGVRSVQLDTSGFTADWRATHFAVSANDSYRLRGFVTGTGSAQTFLTIRWFSDTDATVFISEDNIILNSTYTDWTEVKNDFIAPATAQSADIVFRCPNPTTVDISGDEFSVRKVI